MKDARDPGTMELEIETKWEMADTIEALLELLKEEIASKREEYNRIQLRIDSLKMQGLIYAGTHYKAGKYLYLVYPVADDGSRERHYIGADPEKIAEALAGIERGKEYTALQERMTRLDGEARQCYNNVHYARVNLKG